MSAGPQEEGLCEDAMWSHLNKMCLELLACRNPFNPQNAAVLGSGEWLYPHGSFMAVCLPCPSPMGPSAALVSNSTLSPEKKGTVVFPFFHPQSGLLLTQTMTSESYKSNVSRSLLEISCLISDEIKTPMKKALEKELAQGYWIRLGWERKCDYMSKAEYKVVPMLRPWLLFRGKDQKGTQTDEDP